eukprot:gene4217-5281_t
MEVVDKNIIEEKENLIYLPSSSPSPHSSSSSPNHFNKLEEEIEEHEEEKDKEKEKEKENKNKQEYSFEEEEEIDENQKLIESIIKDRNINNSNNTQQQQQQQINNIYFESPPPIPPIPFYRKYRNLNYLTPDNSSDEDEEYEELPNDISFISEYKASPFNPSQLSRPRSYSSITRPVLLSDTAKVGNHILILLALSIFFSVSNLFCVQPLLNEIGEKLDVSNSVMSIISMSVQIGYAFGLLFISILGDVISKKKLILVLSIITCGSLIGVGLSQHASQFILFYFVVGASTIIPNIAIPLAIDLTNPQERNNILVILMTSLFVGLLGARVLSGVIGYLFGWRVVFFFASATIFIISILLFYFLPYTPRIQNPQPYPKLVYSIMINFREKVLRQTCFIGSMVFATFSILWTTLSFRLNDEPYHYSSGFIGLFGLIGMAGAIASPITGKLVGRIGLNVLMVIYLVISLAGYLVLIQSTMSTTTMNQEENNTKINAVYMSSYFIGGSIGSGLCGFVYSHWKWTGSCILAMVFLGAALTCHLMYFNDPLINNEINNNNDQIQQQQSEKYIQLQDI